MKHTEVGRADWKEEKRKAIVHNYQQDGYLSATSHDALDLSHDSRPPTGSLTIWATIAMLVEIP